MALVIYEAAMAILYLTLGVVLLFQPLFNSIFKNNMQINDGLRIMLGIILGLYGIYRVSRVIKKITQKKNYN